MPPSRIIPLRLALARLRLSTWWAGKRVRSLRSKAEGEGKRWPPRRWPYVAVLTLCFAAAVSAVVVSILAQGAPMLRTIDGRLPSLDELVILDPDRRDETKLSPGYLYDRPVAAVQTGSAPVLLRARLEETLLTASRDANGRVVEAKPTRAPGENYEPYTIPQDEALRQLADGGVCKPNASWEDALKQKLPARRLPGGDNDGGRLLIFEKKTVIADPDADIPDLSVLPPEVLEQYDLGNVYYAYMGFYYINEGGAHTYQPLHITVDDPAPRRPAQRPPSITGLAYDFYRWDVTQEQVHTFNEEADAPVNLQPGELRPLEAWTQPEDAWFYDADGWVYYGQALEPGAMTPLLLRSFTVLPESPLVSEETRYRLFVRAQSAPLVHGTILQLWYSGAPLGTLGGNKMTNEAADALFGRAYPPEAGVIKYE
ncbi:MAG: hypothetical protein LBB75_06295 [Oscillospiraceae bacterium]|jgi:hypothetical protein|nr:hypothetical protein [Oscillospiraceae bacterium]